MLKREGIDEPYLYKGIWVRGKQEEWIVREMKLYKLLKIEKGDRVLDIGAHIGCAANYFLERGAKIVHSYEPEPSNYGLLLRNTEGRRVECFNKAIVDSPRIAPTIQLWLSQGKFTTTHSVHKRRGRQAIEVPCRTLWKAIQKFNPTTCKIDIEGGELELLHDLERMGRESEVRAVVMELHYLLKDSKEKARKLRAIMGKYFRAVMPPKYLDQETGGWHTCLAYWER